MEGIKIILAAGLSAFASFVTYQTVRNTIVRKKVQIQVLTEPKNINTAGFDLHFNISVTNPTRFSFSMKHPELTLFHNNQSSAVSEKNEKIYKVPANGSIQVDTVVMKVRYVNLFSSFPDFVTNIRKGKLIATVRFEADLNGPFSIEKIVPVQVDLLRQATEIKI